MPRQAKDTIISQCCSLEGISVVFFRILRQRCADPEDNRGLRLFSEPLSPGLTSKNEVQSGS